MSGASSTCSGDLRGPQGHGSPAPFIASRCDPRLQAFRKRLQDAGKPFKLAITACARKLLTILDATLRDGTDYAKPAS